VAGGNRQVASANFSSPATSLRPPCKRRNGPPVTTYTPFVGWSNFTCSATAAGNQLQFQFPEVSGGGGSPTLTITTTARRAP
jgi:hypothetical protein